jgi:putative glutamine amidotransferase
MKKPRILITTSNVNSASLEPITGDTEILYTDKAAAAAVIQAGGLPVYLPSLTLLDTNDLQAYLADADGVLITGADTNTNPLYYGEKPTHLEGRIDDERDQIDIALIKLAYQAKVPLLGICKGMQIINVALGGTLYQKVTAQLPGSFDHDIKKTSRSNLTHTASLTEGSMLQQIFRGTELSANGGHQQAVKTLPASLTAVATASDSVVEAYEGIGYPFLLGIQFHAELRQFDEPFKAIFTRFIAAARNND